MSSSNNPASDIHEKRMNTVDNIVDVTDKEFGYGDYDDDDENDDDCDENEEYDFIDRNRPVNISHNLILALGLINVTGNPVEMDGKWKPPKHHGLSNSSPVSIYKGITSASTSPSSIIPVSSSRIRHPNAMDIDESVDGFLNNPIQSGYLLEYCKSKYNAENMIYVLEIYKFKDICSDLTAWSDEISYQGFDSSFENFHSTRLQEADLIFGSQSSKNKWPSKHIQFCSIQEHIKMIWDTYLSSSSPTQVCISSTVLSNTIHRLKYLHVYGNQVFDETLIDPVRTINREILPKFLKSRHCHVMKSRLQSLNPLPHKSTFEMRLPSHADVLNWSEAKLTIENLRQIPLRSVFHDYLVYEQFLKYAVKIYAEENVYLLRAITIFRCHCSSFDPLKLAAGMVPFEIEEQAWFIYRYFIAAGSAYEMSGLSHTQVKSIMSDLAHPHVDMFLEVEEDVRRFTHILYEDFSHTEEFKIIPSMIKNIAFEKLVEKEKERKRKALEKQEQDLIANTTCLVVGRKPVNENRNRKHKMKTSTQSTMKDVSSTTAKTLTINKLSHK